MKKVFSIFLAFTMIIALATMSACGPQNEEPKPADNQKTETTSETNSREQVQPTVGGQNAETVDQIEPGWDENTPEEQTIPDEQGEDTEIQPIEDIEQQNPSAGIGAFFPLDTAIITDNKATVIWTDETGAKKNMLDLKGKVYLIDVWADWCIWCKRSSPKVKEFYDKYSDKGLTIIGINTDTQDKIGEAQQYVTDEGLNYTILSDPNSMTRGVFFDQGIPSFVLMDSSGNVITIHPGALIAGDEATDQFEQLIQKMLGL